MALPERKAARAAHARQVRAARAAGRRPRSQSPAEAWGSMARAKAAHTMIYGGSLRSTRAQARDELVSRQFLQRLEQVAASALLDEEMSSFRQLLTSVDEGRRAGTLHPSLFALCRMYDETPAFAWTHAISQAGEMQGDPGPAKIMACQLTFCMVMGVGQPPLPPAAACSLAGHPPMAPAAACSLAGQPPTAPAAACSLAGHPPTGPAAACSLAGHPPIWPAAACSLAGRPPMGPAAARAPRQVPAELAATSSLLGTLPAAPAAACSLQATGPGSHLCHYHYIIHGSLGTRLTALANQQAPTILACIQQAMSLPPGERQLVEQLFPRTVVLRNTDLHAPNLAAER